MNIENKLLNNPPNVEEELDKEISEGLIEAALLKGQKVNEGKSGVIFEINVDKLPEEIVDFLFEGQEKKNLAGKILKIYARGQGEKEVKMHQKAYEILQNENEKFVKIPEILIYKEIEIKSDTLKQMLHDTGITNNKIEIILMDFIEGEDMITHLYKQVLLKHPESEFNNSPDNLENIEFTELQLIVSKLFNFAEVNNSQAPEQQILRDRENRNKIISFLRKNGVILDKKIFTKINAIIKILNDNNIFHNDLHERNIMFEFDENGNITNVYLIDFGDASEEEDESKAGGELGIINKYSILSKTKKETKINELEQLQINLTRLEEFYSISSRKKEDKEGWKYYNNIIRDTLFKNGTEFGYNNLVDIINSCYMKDRENFIGSILLKLSKKNKEKILEALKKEKLESPQFWLDLITIIQNP